MNIDLSSVSAIISLASALVAWAVIPWRVSQLEIRLQRLEAFERDMSTKMASIQTELRLTRQTVEKIAEKLDVNL
jgi:hypothetical protein